MMVLAHATYGMVSSVFFTKRIDRASSGKKFGLFAFAFAANIALHGAMDLFPHSHPIPSYLDMIMAFAIVFLILLIKKPYRVLAVFCYFGSIIPDVIDMGILRVLRSDGLRIFPWHLKKEFIFYEAIYTNTLMNVTFSIVVILACAAIIYLKRKDLVRMISPEFKISNKL